MTRARRKILAADIGGTNARFALYGADGVGADGAAPGPLQCLWTRTYPTRGFAGFALVAHAAGEDCAAHLRQKDPDAVLHADCAVVAAAGAVRGRRCTLTNAPWDVDLDRDALPGSPRLSALINDFGAQAMACLAPRPDKFEVLQPDSAGPDGAEPGGAIAVLGAGTGCGFCLLAEIPRSLLQTGGTRRLPLPSEGGHASFPLLGGEEARYREFLEARGLPPTPDVVLSGGGLERLHEFLTGDRLPAKDVGELVHRGLAARTEAAFARFYGRAARNWALQVLALGGVVVTGGVVEHTPELVRHPAFLEEFRTSRTYGDLLARLPVHLHLDPAAGLDGAALFGRDLLAAESGA
ncbi:MAG: glucokinase [Desulfovibrionaceae bacterium]|jgi:glucokinase|nr:glucokinase [Desulfovibrionaceae bacterium]